MLHDSIDLHHDGRLGEWRSASFSFFVDDTKSDQSKILLLTSQRVLNQKLEGGLGSFKLESFVLHPLELLDNLTRLRGAFLQINSVLSGLPQDIGLPGQLRNEDAPMISHKFGIDVLIGLRMLEHGRDVDAALVGERRITHKRLVLPGLAVRKL